MAEPSVGRHRASRLVLDLRAGSDRGDQDDALANDASSALLELSYALSEALTCADVAETVEDWAGRRLGTTFGVVQWPAVSSPAVPAPAAPPEAAPSDPPVVALPLPGCGPDHDPGGVLRLGWAPDQQIRLDDAVRSLLDQVARHTGQALRRALAHEEQRTVAHALRSAVLPDQLPQPAGWHLAAAYVPAVRQPTVGGDWYDAFPLDGNRLALTVGDAAGHGPEAARVMSSLRNALRAYAVMGEGPHRVLERVDHLLARTDPDAFATAVHLEVDLDGGRVVWAGAGHPAPLVVRRASGTTAPAFARQGGPADPPLGTPDVGARHTANFRLRPGDSLLLYTDGLVERRDQDVDTGLDMLRQAASSAPAGPGQIGAILEQLLDGVDPADDVCLLALTRLPRDDQAP